MVYPRPALPECLQIAVTVIDKRNQSPQRVGDRLQVTVAEVMAR